MIIRKGLLSMKEADRVYVIGQVTERRLGQRQAAERLGLSVRQVKRLVARYRDQGGRRVWFRDIGASARTTP